MTIYRIWQMIGLILAFGMNEFVVSFDASCVVPVYVITDRSYAGICTGTVIEPKLILAAKKCLHIAKAATNDSQEMNLFIYSNKRHTVHINNRYPTDSGLLALELETALHDVYMPKPFVVRTNMEGKIFTNFLTRSMTEIKLILRGSERFKLAFEDTTRMARFYTGSGVFVDCLSGKCLAGVVTNEPGQSIEFFMGCPLDNYDESAMKIYNYRLENSELATEIKPPTGDGLIKIECINGHQLVVGSAISTYSSIELVCSRTKWMQLEGQQPQCTKLCRASELNQLYAMEAKCYLDGISVNCQGNALNLPGTVANLTCAIGFRNLGQTSVKCLRNGSWQGLEDLWSKEWEYCSQECEQAHPHTLYQAGKEIELDAIKAPWTVAIYIKSKRTPRQILANKNFNCSGSLIRLDLVLTAAHCLFDDHRPIEENNLLIGYLRVNTQSISNVTQLREVQRYWLHPEFRYGGDIAILQLKQKVDAYMDQGIVCLPWFKMKRTISHNLKGHVNTWSRSTQDLRIVGFQTTDLSRNRNNFNITLQIGEMLCRGDSGSPLVVYCNGEEEEWDGKCLVGVISETKGAAQENTLCTSKIVAVNLLYKPFMNFIETILKSYNREI